MKPHPDPLVPEHCDTVGDTHVLKGFFRRARAGRTGPQLCRLVEFSLGNYRTVEVGCVFADDHFEPRLSGINRLTKEQRAALVAALKKMGIACHEQHR